jgi:hypothetical protein
MDEDDRELGTRGVWAMPVGEVPGGRSLATEQGNWSKGEQREETCQRSAVDVEARILQSAKGQEINEADTLQES